jgi:ribosomal-protein-alanine N-acetyltransferase
MNIKIRKLKIDDALIIAQLIDNHKITDNLRDGIPSPYSEKDAVGFIERNEDSPSFAITAEDELVGVIGLTIQQNIHRKNAEIGYWISESFWGKGIASEAVKLICAYGFENLDIVRVFAEVFSPNIASQKVLEKSGFKKECVIEGGLIKNNVLLDEHLYSIHKVD